MPTQVVISTTEHPAEEAANLWLRQGGAACHYLVTGDGDIWQFVSDADTAYHAGNKQVNEMSVGIAVEGYADPDHASNNPICTLLKEKHQFQSLVQLVRWLSQTYGIPINRQSVYGKNEVPGVATRRFPASGLETWGGASNQYSPGPMWNWTRVIEELGCSTYRHGITVLDRSSVRCAPRADAPLITYAQRGSRLIAYGENGDHFLAYVTGEDVKQPYLPSGSYHWDGWIQKSSVIRQPNLTYIESDLSSQLHPLYTRAFPKSYESRRGVFAPGHCAVLTGKQEGNDSESWLELYFQSPGEDGTAWIKANSQCSRKTAS